MATHTVQPGDSLSLISQKYFGDFSMADAIARMNNITNVDVIFPGKVLELPIASGEEVAKSWKKIDRLFIFGGLILAGITTYIAYKNYKKSKGKKALSGVKSKTKINKAYVQNLIDENNKDVGSDFKLQQAYGNYEIWSGGNRIDAGSIKDVYNTFIKYRFNEKYRK